MEELTYSKYLEFGGVSSEMEFKQLLGRVKDLMLNYTAELVPRWNMKPNLEEMIETNKLYTYQIDFIAQNGGVNVFNGQNDLDLKQVSTAGFTYSIAAGERLEFYNGIPIAPMAKSMLEQLLRQNGYLYRGLA